MDCYTPATLAERWGCNVTFTKENLDAYNSIMDCPYAAVYGGDQNVCVVVGGCKAQPNAYFWSGNHIVMDPGYFPFEQYNLAGDTEERITGFGKQQSMLVIFKEHSVGRAVFDTVEMASGRVMLEMPYTNINSCIGCDLPWTIQLIENNLVFCNTEQGVHLVRDSSSARENNIETLSRNVNGNEQRPGLLEKVRGSEVTTSFDDGQRYWVVAGGEAFVWDYVLSQYSDPSWFYFTNINAAAFFRKNERAFHMNGAGRITAMRRVLHLRVLRWPKTAPLPRRPPLPPLLGQKLAQRRLRARRGRPRPRLPSVRTMLKLNTPRGKSVFERLTGVKVPSTSDTKTLISTARTAVTQAAERKIAAATETTRAEAGAQAGPVTEAAGTEPQTGAPEAVAPTTRADSAAAAWRSAPSSEQSQESFMAQLEQEAAMAAQEAETKSSPDAEPAAAFMPEGSAQSSASLLGQPEQEAAEAARDAEVKSARASDAGQSDRKGQSIRAERGRDAAGAAQPRIAKPGEPWYNGAKGGEKQCRRRRERPRWRTAERDGPR